MIKTLGSSLLACMVVLGSAQAAFAQQTLNFTVGLFTPRGEDARVDGDVLRADLNSLDFQVSDFNSAVVGGEWLIGFGQFFEGGAGVGFSRRTVPSVYRDLVSNNGSEIEQELRLRVVPVSFTVRALPLGQSNPFQPYIGAGIGIFNWRYSETGQFVDVNGGIFRDAFVDSGSATGPVVLGGVRFAGDTMSAGGEVRYQKAEGDLSSAFEGNKIDLGGWTYQFTVGVRFK